jgi:Tol biopolymer transport system component
MKNSRKIVCTALGVILSLNTLSLATLHAQTLTRATSTNANAAALRVNGKIAFTSDRDGNQEIYLMNADGSDQVRLTNNPGEDSFPTFSPDGSRIAFVSQNASGDFAIKLMDVDGINQTEVTPIAFDSTPYPWHEAWSLSWSPNGAKIAFQENGEIFTIDIDGSNRTNLTNNPAMDSEPSWSPDGSRILFISSRVPYLTMHTMNVDGSGVRALPNEDETWDTSPDFSPTGQEITFIMHSEVLLPVLYTANADGTNRQPFDGCAGGVCSEHRSKPKWSPDGTKIVFHSWDYFRNDAEIYVKNVDGTYYAQLTNTSGNNFQPSWQPLLAPNVIDETQFFVRQHYLDFLNRQPDESGMAFWTNEIAMCGSDAGCIEFKRINVSAAFFLSIEFQETGYLVYKFYKAAYGNLPGAPVPVRYDEFVPDTQQISQDVVVGSSSWQAKLESNKQAYAADFVARARFTTAYATSLTPEQFVDMLYANAGVASPPAAERTDAINEFGGAGNTADNAARARALRRIAEDSTLGQQELNGAFVLMQYFGYLRRNPYDPPEPTLDYQGYNFWLGKLNQFNGNYRDAEMVKAFLVSGEYRQRFAQ